MRTKRFILLLLFITACPILAADHCYYSPADNIIYIQYGWGEITYVCSNGGGTIARIAATVPGMICTSEPVPGKIYCMPFLSPESFITLYGSDDGGLNWETVAAFTGDAYYLEGCEGSEPGESFLRGACCTFFTNDGWQTRDSLPGQTYDPVITTEMIAHRGETALGWQSTNTILLSSDTGRTWDAEHPISLGAHRSLGDLGVAGEIWIHDWISTGDSIYVITDNGAVTRTVMKTPYMPHPDASFFLIATEKRGEAFCIIDSVYWSTNDVDLFVYHIQDYGARIDTFYHFMAYNAASEPPVAEDFRVAVYPNPFNAVVTFAWEGLRGDVTNVTITDLLGRRVWDWQGSQEKIQWNGRTSDGLTLPSGKYWATVKRGEMNRVVPVVLLK